MTSMALLRLEIYIFCEISVDNQIKRSIVRLYY